MKRLLILTLFVFVISNLSFAQFYDSGEQLSIYVDPNKSEDSNPMVYMFYFEGKKGVCIHTTMLRFKRELKNNPKYWENQMDSEEFNMTYYDSDYNTTTYKHKEYHTGMGGYSSSVYYTFIFSDDRSSLTIKYSHSISIGPGSGSSNASDTYYLKKVDKKDYLPRGLRNIESDVIYE